MMGDVIEVIYRDGVLKPLKKIDLREGEIVRIEIKGKVLTDRFYKKLDNLRKKIVRVKNASQILEDIRDDSY